MYLLPIIENALASASGTPAREAYQLLFREAQSLGPQNDGLLSTYLQEAACALLTLTQRIQALSDTLTELIQQYHYTDLTHERTGRNLVALDPSILCVLQRPDETRMICRSGEDLLFLLNEARTSPAATFGGQEHARKEESV